MSLPTTFTPQIVYEGLVPDQERLAVASVLLVDDNRLFDEVITSVLGRMDISVVGCTASAEEALALTRRLRPTLVLVDLQMSSSDGTGRDIAITLLESCDASVLALTDSAFEILDTELLTLGLSGFVLKDGSLSRFERGLIAALEGDIVIPQSVAGTGRQIKVERSDEVALLTAQLTEREWDVLALLVAGVTGRTIGTRLGISANTVRTHVQSILSKLQVHSRLEAAAFAVRHNLIPIPQEGSPRRRQGRSA